MTEIPGYGDLLTIGERAMDRYKNVILFGDDHRGKFAEIYHRILIKQWPDTEQLIDVAAVARIDIFASGHSDYRETMAIRMERRLRRAA